MGAHWTVASEGAAGVAVSWVGEGVVFDLIIPRFHQLKDGPIPAKRIKTSLIWKKPFFCVFPSFLPKCLLTFIPNYLWYFTSWPGHRHNLRCWSLLTLLTRCQVICCSVTVSHVTTAVYGGMRYGLNPEQPEYALVSSSRLMCCWGFVCSFILYGTPSVLHFQLNGRRTYEQFDSDSPVTKYLRLSQQVRSSGLKNGLKAI